MAIAHRSTLLQSDLLKHVKSRNETTFVSRECIFSPYLPHVSPQNYARTNTQYFINTEIHTLIAHHKKDAYTHYTVTYTYSIHSAKYKKRRDKIHFPQISLTATH